MKKILGCEGVEGNGGNISSSGVDMAASKENFAAQNGSNSDLPLAYVDHGHATKVQVNKDQARLVYAGHYTGLQTYGLSGMTIQDELIDHAFMACENRRSANQKDHARGAAVLANGGKLYTGCDVTINGDTNGMGCISGERAAILAAVADGQSSFDCLVIASDTMKSFPAPNGQSREFLRSLEYFLWY